MKNISMTEEKIEKEKKDKTNNDSDSDEDIFDFFKQKKNFSLIGDLNQEKMSK